MNEKHVRYLATVIGILFTLLILYINDPYYIDFGGLIGDSISTSLVFNLFKHIILTASCRHALKEYIMAEDMDRVVHNMDASSYFQYCFDTHSTLFAYFLWFSCLFLGVMLSWKLRYRTARHLKKLFSLIDKNI